MHSPHPQEEQGEAIQTQAALVTDELRTLLGLWLTIAPPREQRRFLERHSEMLAIESDRILQELIASYTEQPEDQHILRFRLNILQDARARGGTVQAIGEAYINIGAGFVLDLPYWLEVFIQQVDAINNLGQPARTATKCKEMIQDALTRARKEALVPEIQAELLCLLGRTQVDMRVHNPQAVAEATRFYEEALQTYTLARYPFQYARTKCEMGMIYGQSTTSQRQAHLEQAITCYKEALQVLTRDTFPVQWANVQNNLADAYRNRMTGDRNDNLEQSIACLESILSIHTQKTSPVVWAMAQLNLGNAYGQRMIGVHSDNLELAITCYEAALQVFTRESSPIYWAMLQNNLGEAYRRRVAGVESENEEQALKHLESALLVLTREAFPIEWAMTQISLGSIYATLTQGEPFSNLKLAVAHYETALQVYTQAMFPFEWAKIQVNLGKAYEKCLVGEKRDSIERAILHYQAALRVYTSDSSPLQWVEIQALLGDVYTGRKEGTRQSNLELAISFYDAAVQFLLNKTLSNSPGYVKLLKMVLRTRPLHPGRVEDLEQAIQIYQYLVHHISINAPDWPALLGFLTTFLLGRYYRTGQLQDLEQIIQVLEGAIRETSREVPSLPGFFSMLSKGLYLRWLRNGQFEDLERAINSGRQALRVDRSHDASRQPDYFNILGLSLRDRYTHKGNVEDLEQSIQAFEDAIAYATRSTPDYPIYLANLSISWLLRYAASQQMEDLERALQTSQRASEGLRADSPNLPFVLLTQGNSLHTKYNRTGELEDLEQVIQRYEAGLQVVPVDSPDLASYLISLGSALNLRYEHTGQVGDIEKSIDIFRRAAQRVPSGSPAIPGLLYYLSNALLLHYEHSGHQEEVEEAIENCRRALELAAPGAVLRASLLNNLGMGLSTRFLYTGQTQDAEEAIQICKEAVKQTAPGSPALPRHLSNLGAVLQRRYVYSGLLEDIEQAIKAYQDTIQITPSNSPILPAILSKLGVALLNRYEQTGQLQDLEQAVKTNRETVQITSRNVSNFPRYLSLLGLSLRLQYESTGKRGDLEEMLAVMQQAMVLVPPDAPARFYVYHLLGISLFSRYERTGRLEDLDQAINVCQRSIDSLSPRSPVMSEMLMTLSTVFLNRYGRTEKLEDLEQAMAIIERAVQSVSPTSPSRPQLLGSLGAVLLSRYLRVRDQKDLDRAIEVCRTAMLSMSTDTPSWPLFSSNLSVALRLQYESTGKLDYLEQAIAVCQEGIEHTTADSPKMPVLLSKLGLTLQIRYEKVGYPEDKQQAIALYEETCQKSLLLGPDTALSCSCDWGNWAMERADWAEAARAYKYGIQALGLLYREQLLLANRETRLYEAKSMYDRAAYAQARAGQLREAVTTLEQGRARGLSEALARDRADLGHLQREDQELYQRYVRGVERLRQLESAELTNTLSLLDDRVGAPPISLAERVRLAREDLERAIAAIRRIPGYADFLTDPTYQSIAREAKPDLPLVYLTTTNAGSMALLVQTASEESEVIWADDFTWDKLSPLLVKGNGEMVVGGYLPGQFHQPWLSDALTEALPLLGIELVGLVARRLRELKASGVILVPTGLLGMLPFHASYYWVEGREVCLLDEFDVAYVPSVRVLATVRHEARTRQNGTDGSAHYLVGVGNPLPDVQVGAWAKSELQRVFSLLQQDITGRIQVLRAFPPSLPPQFLKQVLTQINLWEDLLRSLQECCNEQPEAFIQCGGRLRGAASIFVGLPNISEDVAATLTRVAERIPPSLNYAGAELKSIQSLFPSERVVTFYGHEATKETLWETLPQAALVHFACHGSFNATVPLDSALLLAQDSRLTLRDLFNADGRRLACLRLAVLSACQTAVSDYQRVPNEAVGLLSGFLRAGVPSVVGTLWSVNELSTALVMTRFYDLYLYGDKQHGLSPQQPARALRLAQRWLRELTTKALLVYLEDQQRLKRYHLSQQLMPFVRKAIREGQGETCPYASPYYWAAFVYYGA